ncbi:hypothetical protein J6590_054431 [Homalodisca vitripennis]|nr:hypothetical protein J6590_054431 [Homalodisca vitripennis]
MGVSFGYSCGVSSDGLPARNPRHCHQAGDGSHHMLLQRLAAPVVIDDKFTKLDEHSCSTEKEGELLYLYLPVGVLVYLNMAMFIGTSLRFKSHLKSTKKLQRGDSRRHCSAGNILTTEAQRFSLYLKLSVVMGVTWVLQLVSFYLYSATFISIIIDVANALQGVAIFYLFVCKRSTLHQLKQRLCSSLQLVTSDSAIKTISTSGSGSRRLNSVQSRVSCTSDHSTDFSGVTLQLT